LRRSSFCVNDMLMSTSTFVRQPESDWLKINLDGAFSMDLGGGGWGVAIRGNEGDVVQAAAGKLSYVIDAFQSEV